MLQSVARGRPASRDSSTSRFASVAFRNAVAARIRSRRRRSPHRRRRRRASLRQRESQEAVRTPTGLTTYPDVTVICGAREIDGIDPLAITNPTLIVEVLSRSTEEYDSGDKFEHYKTFPSLREYVLVSHRERSVEVRSRGEDGWRTTVVQEGSIAELSIGARLDVRELYAAAAEPSAAQ